MIAELLSLERPLIVLDCETTGLNPQQDRIIELAFQVHRPGGVVDEWRSLIDPGVPIPEAATRVHGITDEMMKGCRICGGKPGEWNEVILKKHQEREPEEQLINDHQGLFQPIPKFAQVAQRLAKGFTDVDFAGKNVRFDLQFLDAEFRRAAVPWGYAGACVIDADRLEQLAEPRHLAALHKKYVGLEHDDAHSALSDVRATTTVLVKQLERHETTLPRSLRKLHELSWPSWVDADGKFKMRDGVPVVAFGKRYNGVPMKDVPLDFWRDFILKNDFSEEVKRIAREALEGRFPT